MEKLNQAKLRKKMASPQPGFQTRGQFLEGWTLVEKVLALLLLLFLGSTVFYIFYTNVIVPLRKPPS